jgi:hypothetical protein
MCYLQKDIIWDSRTTNNQKEQNRHYCVNICFYSLLGVTRDTVVSILFLFDYLFCDCLKLYLFVYICLCMCVCARALYSNYRNLRNSNHWLLLIFSYEFNICRKTSDLLHLLLFLINYSLFSYSSTQHNNVPT